MKNYLCKNIIIPSCTSNLVILKSYDKYYMYVYNNRFYFLGIINRDNFKIKINESILSINIISNNYTQLPTLKVSYYTNNNRINKISKKISSFLNS